MNLSNVTASTSSSYAGLCKRGRPGRFRCGDHGVKSIAFNAAGTHLTGSWRRRTALHLITPAAVPDRNSSLSVSRPNQRPVTHCCRSSLTLAPGRRARTCSPSGRISFLHSVHESSSHIVSSENPCCVSDRPRKHRKVCCHFKRRDFIFENCQIYSGKSTHSGDGFLNYSIALMALCR